MLSLRGVFAATATTASTATATASASSSLVACAASTAPLRAGQNWRLSQGMPRSGNETGTLVHDTLDFVFEDGSQPALSRRQQRWRRRRDATETRIAQLKAEMDELASQVVADQHARAEFDEHIVAHEQQAADDERRRWGHTLRSDAQLAARAAKKKTPKSYRRYEKRKLARVHLDGSV